jgi:hypothetical protein
VNADRRLTAADDRDFWCEDGHFAAISLLYDVAIINYSTAMNKWYAFNETATGGYVCLLSLPDHTDVLCGIQSNPMFMAPATIPRGVESQAISRQSTNWSNALTLLQRDYAFANVWRWPAGFPGVEILNNNMLQRTGDTERVTTETKSVAKGLKCAWYRCDVEGCKFRPTRKKTALNTHKKCVIAVWAEVRTQKTEKNPTCSPHREHLAGKKKGTLCSETTRA